MSNRALALADTLERVLDTVPWQEGTYDPLTEDNMREIVALLRASSSGDNGECGS